MERLACARSLISISAGNTRVACGIDAALAGQSRESGPGNRRVGAGADAG